MSFSKSGGLPRKKKKTLLSGKKAAKGQLISKCTVNAFKSSEIFVRISALVSKKRSNKEGALYTTNWMILF